jgi:hypothetical protein
MKRIGIFTLIFIFLHIQPTAASSDAAFESEILLGKDGVTRGRLLMSGTRYRLETGPKGEPSVILVDIESGETTIINGDQKTYRSMPTGTRQGLVMNPIEVFRLVSGFYPRQPGGLETVNGLNCRKTTFLSQGRQLITAWNSEGIPIPVKAINHRFPEMNFELLNIRRRLVKPELLTVPPGYRQLMGQPRKGPAATQWAVKAGASQTITLEPDKPFTLMVADDASDGLATRGRMIFLRSAQPPIDRVEAPFKIANGKSLKLAYPASALINSVEFHISKGGVQIKQVESK